MDRIYNDPGSNFLCSVFVNYIFKLKNPPKGVLDTKNTINSIVSRAPEEVKAYARKIK